MEENEGKKRDQKIVLTNEVLYIYSHEYSNSGVLYDEAEINGVNILNDTSQ